MAVHLCLQQSSLATTSWLPRSTGWDNLALSFTAPLAVCVSVTFRAMPPPWPTCPQPLQHQPPSGRPKQLRAPLHPPPSNSPIKAALQACGTCRARGTRCGRAAATTLPPPSRAFLPAAASLPTCFLASALTLALVYAACERAHRPAQLQDASNARFMHNAGINWGTYQDAVCDLSGGCFHCNAHANNLVLVPPGALPDGAPGSTRLVRQSRAKCKSVCGCVTAAAGGCAGLGHGVRRARLHPWHEWQRFWWQWKGELPGNLFH